MAAAGARAVERCGCGAACAVRRRLGRCCTAAPALGPLRRRRPAAVARGAEFRARSAAAAAARAAARPFRASAVAAGSGRLRLRGQRGLLLLLLRRFRLSLPGAAPALRLVCRRFRFRRLLCRFGLHDLLRRLSVAASFGGSGFGSGTVVVSSSAPVPTAAAVQRRALGAPSAPRGSIVVPIGRRRPSCCSGSGCGTVGCGGGGGGLEQRGRRCGGVG